MDRDRLVDIIKRTRAARGQLPLDRSFEKREDPNTIENLNKYLLLKEIKSPSLSNKNPIYLNNFLAKPEFDFHLNQVIYKKPGKQLQVLYKPNFSKLFKY